MIKRSLLAAGLLFVLYNLALFAPGIRTRFAPQSSYQENVAQAQDYVLGQRAPKAVLVGSSLGARLQPTELMRETYNLALIGEGPLTGLEIVRRAPGAPHLVLIETNFLLRPASAQVLEGTFTPVVSQLRAKLPALQERYHPSSLAGHVGGRVLYRSIEALRRERPSASAVPSRAGDDVYQAMLREQRVQFERLADPVELRGRIAELQRTVADLERRGVRCVFLEMPVDPSLAELPQPRQVRSQLQRVFPRDHYQWVRPGTSRAYTTTDGLHLPGPEAKICAAAIAAELSRPAALASFR